VSLGRGRACECDLAMLAFHRARTELAAPWAIPRNFILLIESDSIKRRCHVVRGDAKYLGVAFE